MFIIVLITSLLNVFAQDYNKISTKLITLKNANAALDLETNMVQVFTSAMIWKAVKLQQAQKLCSIPEIKKECDKYLEVSADELEKKIMTSSSEVQMHMNAVKLITDKVQKMNRLQERGGQLLNEIPLKYTANFIDKDTKQRSILCASMFENVMLIKMNEDGSLYDRITGNIKIIPDVVNQYDIVAKIAISHPDIGKTIQVWLENLSPSRIEESGCIREKI